MTWEPGMWVDKFWVGGNTNYTWLKEPITITPTEVTVTIGDVAKWSDGQQFTGKDMAVYPLLQSLRKRYPPYYARAKAQEAVNVWGAFDNVDINDQSVTYRSSPGHFEQFWDWTLRTRFGIWGLQGDAAIPTHIEPYDEFADAVIETAKLAQKGEINPWKGWDNPREQPDDPHKASLVDSHLAKRGKYVAKFSKPDNVVSNSAWDLIVLEGTNAVFKPNPHHRNTEAINFDRVNLEYTPSAERERAALKADHLDYAAPGPTPQSIIDSLPGHITQLLIPGNLYSGNELGLNFSHPGLGKHKVRSAIMYALDHEAITKNIHEFTANPVETPGGDCWDATDYVNKTWIDENLTTYTTNRKKASRLMREAGYKRDGGKWVNANGRPLTLTLPTPRTTPRWEPTVANQLSQFGLHTSVRTLDKSTFSARVSNGEFPIWPHFGVSTNKASVTLEFWFAPVKHATKYEIYTREQFDTGDFSRGRLPSPRTEENWRVFTIKAPPIGEPNGLLQEYHPSALALAFINNPPEDEFRHRVKTAMWLANWFLPTIPINKTMKQHFIDDAHWMWPTDTPLWQTFTNGGPKLSGGVFASGTIRAKPNNPEEDASVREKR